MKYRLAFCTAALAGLAGCSNGSTANGANAAANNNVAPAAPATPAPAPTPTLRDLTALLSFSKPARCETGKALTALVARMEKVTKRGEYSFADAPLTPPGFDAPITVAAKQIGKDNNGSWKFTLPLDGQWLGLHVVGLEHLNLFGGESSGLNIRFDAPQAEVAAALHKAGFTLSKASKNDDTARDLGLTPEGDAEEYADSYLKTDGDSVVFTCDNYYEF